MIIVTGANGYFGGRVVQNLLSKRPADQIGVSVRDPEAASKWEEQGVRVRRGDFAEPDSLRHSFAGAERLLIVSANRTGSEAVALHRNAIQAAVDAGVARIAYTSQIGARADSDVAPMRDHAETEAILADSGVPYVSLRNGFYASSGFFMMGRFLQTWAVEAPPDGPVSWTTREDLAEAAAGVLLGTVDWSGISPPLTGSEAVDFRELARFASEILGRSIPRVEISEAEQKQRGIDAGVPEPIAEMLVAFYRASGRGDFARVDPALEKLLGRPPTPVREALADFIHSAR